MNFKIWLQRSSIALLAAFAIGHVVAQDARDVMPLNPPQPVENDGKIEVIEFFAYGCIHCANLEPRLVEWIARQQADVKIKRVPAAALVRGIDSIPIYYTLEAMGVLNKLHQKLFDAANVDNVMLGNPATLKQWLEKQGVDAKKYDEIQKSFSVQNKINRARKMSTDYNVQSTPSIAVNGRYLFMGAADHVFTKIDQLIAQTRESNKTAAAPSTSKAKAPALPKKQ